MPNNLEPRLIGEWLCKEAGDLLCLHSNGNYTYTNGGNYQQGRWGANQTKLVLISSLGAESIHAINIQSKSLTIDGRKYKPTPDRPNIPAKLCGHWCFYNQGTLYGGGFFVQRQLVLESDGRYQYQKESHQNAKFGQADLSHREQGHWKLQGTHLILQPDHGQAWQMSLDLANNRNNEPCLILDGQAYPSKHPRPPWQ